MEFNEDEFLNSFPLGEDESNEEENEGTNEECPIIEMVEEMLCASYSPKPFGIMWTDEDIKEFLTKIGYNLAEIGDNVVAYKGAKKPKSFSLDLDFKNVFISECKEISKDMLYKKWKELNDDNNK